MVLPFCWAFCFCAGDGTPRNTVRLPNEASCDESRIGMHGWVPRHLHRGVPRIDKWNGIYESILRVAREAAESTGAVGPIRGRRETSSAPQADARCRGCPRDPIEGN